MVTNLVNPGAAGGSVSRAVRGTQIIDPDGVRRYLQSKFGDDLGKARMEMRQLATGYTPKDWAANAFSLYERFSPSIPEGLPGWGAQRRLDLTLIERLAKRKP